MVSCARGCVLALALSAGTAAGTPLQQPDAAAAAAAILASLTGRIKHVIVLMLENRSFDHFFGLASDLLGTNGITGKETNLYNTSDPSGGSYTVNQGAVPNLNDCDPDHGTPATTNKIFGADAVGRGDFSDPGMYGFIEGENSRGKSSLNYCDVMSTFSPDQLPVITGLAAEFAVMDRFFASVPGPTWPNRMFTLSGTSAGSTGTGPWYKNQVGELFPQRTFFDQVAEGGLAWRNYYNDTPWELFMEGVAHAEDEVRPMDEFWADARTGALPAFAWLNPRSGINITTGAGASDQHPDHDVAVGEGLIKDVYEALRASPAWNDTLFVVTYDEHGGFWDHVPTPLGAPPPNDPASLAAGSSYPDAFAFDRLGVRIPTLLISPWVPKGTVVSAPPSAQKPAPNSEFELSSIIATARKLLALEKAGPLTARDAWAATFEHVLASLVEPRADCPLHAPEPPPFARFPVVPGHALPSVNGAAGSAGRGESAVAPAAAAAPFAAHPEALLPINELQEHITTTLHWLAYGVEGPPRAAVRQQGHVGGWVQPAIASHQARTSAWLAAKAATKAARGEHSSGGGPSVVCQPRPRYTGKGHDDEGWVLAGRLASARDYDAETAGPGSSSGRDLDSLDAGTDDWQVLATMTMRTTAGVGPHGANVSVPWCLDAPSSPLGVPTPGQPLGVSPCFTTAAKKYAGKWQSAADQAAVLASAGLRDKALRWVLLPDATLRPHADRGLCASCRGLSGLTSLATLEECDGSFHQHFAFHGAAPGSPGGGMMYYGDYTNSMGVTTAAVPAAN